MKLNEMVYDVISAVRDHSDDTFVTESYIEHLINQYRALYLRRDFNKRPYITLDSRQSIVLPMKSINSSVIPRLIETNRIIVSSKNELPQLVTLGKHPGIYSITSVDRNIGEFELMEKKRARYALDAPMCATVAFIDTDNKLYISSKKDSYTQLKYIVLDAVLEDPREALNYLYIDEDGNTIRSLTELGEYPISQALWVYVKADVINEIIREKSTAPDLEASTAQSNINPQSANGINQYSRDTSQKL